MVNQVLHQNPAAALLRFNKNAWAELASYATQVEL